MSDAMDNAVENTQRSACATSHERARDDQLQVGVGSSATKFAGDTTTDNRKRADAPSPTKVPSSMCIYFIDPRNVSWFTPVLDGLSTYSTFSQ